MRATRTAPVLAAALTLLFGASVAAVTTVYDFDTAVPINGVAGSMTLDPATSYGEFSVEEGVFQWRKVPLTGSPLLTDDPRLTGQLDSEWNWDVLGSGAQPVPAWGTMRIDVPPPVTADLGEGTTPPSDARLELVAGDEGAWVGTFTGVRRGDLEPFTVRAFLIGEGAYEGLCATLDIEAGTHAWLVDGVIHPDPMAG